MSNPGTKRPKRRAARSVGPSEVSPGVFVGGWREAVGFRGSRFCVLDAPPEEMPPATHIPIYDAARDEAMVPNLDRLVAAARRARTDGRPVLFFCGHGVRRSPLAAAWYLHRTQGLSLEAAYAQIRTVRPRVETAREWIGSVENLGPGAR